MPTEISLKCWSKENGVMCMARDGMKGADSMDVGTHLKIPSHLLIYQPLRFNYITNNYPTDTLQKAFKNRDSSLVILSKSNGVFANVFSADGTFISRTELSAHGKGNCNGIAETDLPAVIS